MQKLLNLLRNIYHWGHICALQDHADENKIQHFSINMVTSSQLQFTLNLQKLLVSNRNTKIAQGVIIRLEADLHWQVDKAAWSLVAFNDGCSLPSFTEYILNWTNFPSFHYQFATSDSIYT